MHLLLFATNEYEQPAIGQTDPIILFKSKEICSIALECESMLRTQQLYILAAIITIDEQF